MKCNNCKNKGLFYTKGRPTGTVKTVYNGEGKIEEAFNDEQYENVSYTEGKMYYCYMCDKKVAPVKNEIDDILNQFS